MANLSFVLIQFKFQTLFESGKRYSINNEQTKNRLSLPEKAAYIPDKQLIGSISLLMAAWQSE